MLNWIQNYLYICIYVPPYHVQLLSQCIQQSLFQFSSTQQYSLTAGYYELRWKSVSNKLSPVSIFHMSDVLLKNQVQFVCCGFYWWCKCVGWGKTDVIDSDKHFAASRKERLTCLLLVGKRYRVPCHEVLSFILIDIFSVFTLHSYLDSVLFAFIILQCYKTD